MLTFQDWASTNCCGYQGKKNNEHLISVNSLFSRLLLVIWENMTERHSLQCVRAQRQWGNVMLVGGLLVLLVIYSCTKRVCGKYIMSLQSAPWIGKKNRSRMFSKDFLKITKSASLCLFFQNKYCRKNMFNSCQDSLQVPGESTRGWGNGVLKYLSERCIFSSRPFVHARVIFHNTFRNEIFITFK